MDIVSFVIEFLKQKKVITPLEQDILDTYHELGKTPFDRDASIKKIRENNINYPDIFVAISASPATVYKPWEEASDEDVCSNLMSQLGVLAEKEWKVLQCGQ